MAAVPKLKMTHQRRAIMDALRSGSDHPTADEVYQRVRQELPHISLGTVYRNLAVLTQAGLVRRLDIASAPSRFEADLSRHYHIRCQRCAQVDDVPLEPLDGIEERLADQTDYEVQGHHLEFFGLCPRCKAAESEA